MSSSGKKDFTRGFMGLHQGMERLFSEVFRTQQSGVYDRDQVWCPAVDVFETDDGFVVKAELAGVERENLSLSFDKGRLVMAGCREDRCCRARQSCKQMEISYGPFKRSVFVANNVDVDAIRARFNDGMLEVFLPRAVAGRHKKVAIRFE